MKSLSLAVCIICLATTSKPDEYLIVEDELHKTFNKRGDIDLNKQPASLATDFIRAKFK